MYQRRKDPPWPLKGRLTKCHSWHDIEHDEHFPALVTAHVETVPADTVRHEVPDNPDGRADRSEPSGQPLRNHPAHAVRTTGGRACIDSDRRFREGEELRGAALRG